MEVAALEINSKYLRAIKILARQTAKGQTLAVRQVAETVLPAGLIQDGQLINPENFRQVLRQFLRTNHFSNSHWIVSLSEGAIFTTSKIFPNLTAEDLEAAVEMNAAALLPGNPAEIFWGWQEIQSVKSMSGQEVQIASIAKNILENYLLVFDRLGIVPIAIEPKSCSIARVFGQTNNLLILNLEGDVLTSVIIKGGFVRFARESQTKDLIAEARKTINYYLAEKNETAIEKIVLDGSGAKGELAAQINETFKIETKCTIDIFQISGFKISSLPLIGAGIRALGDPSQDMSLSLLPVGRKEASEEKRTLLFYGGLANIIVITCLLFLLLFFGTWGLMKYLNQNVSSQLATLANTSGAQGENGDIEQKINDLKPYLDQEATIEGQLTYWAEVLRGVQKTIPQGVVLTQLNYPGTGEILTIVGQADSREALATFRDSLASEDFAKAVQMPSSNFSEKQIINFTITLTINKEALKSK